MDERQVEQLNHRTLAGSFEIIEDACARIEHLQETRRREEGPQDDRNRIWHHSEVHN